MAVQIKGAVMQEQHEQEFPRNDPHRYFTQRCVRRLLEEYHAIYDPWMHEDPEERTVRDRFKKTNQEPAIFRLADLKASIDYALHRLTVDDPEAADVIIGIYIEGDCRISDTWDNAAANVGQPTAVSAEDRGVKRISRYLCKGE